MVRLRKEQMLVDGKEETAIAVYWVTGGDDCCRVGFLKRSMVMHDAMWRMIPLPNIYMHAVTMGP